MTITAQGTSQYDKSLHFSYLASVHVALSAMPLCPVAILYQIGILTPSISSSSLIRTMAGSCRSLNVLPATVAATTGDAMRVPLGASAIGNKLDSLYSEKNTPISSTFTVFRKMVAGRKAYATSPGNSSASSSSFWDVSTLNLPVWCAWEKMAFTC